MAPRGQWLLYQTGQGVRGSVFYPRARALVLGTWALLQCLCMLFIWFNICKLGVCVFLSIYLHVVHFDCISSKDTRGQNYCV